MKRYLFNTFSAVTVCLCCFAVLILLSCGRSSTSAHSQGADEAGSRAATISFPATITGLYVSLKSGPVYRIADRDSDKVLHLLANARYDFEWNESGIMVKMVEPDYTLQLISDNEEQGEFIFIWRNGGKMKYDGKWYLLEPENGERLYRILDSYDIE